MTLRAQVQSLLDAQVRELVECAEFQALESGSAGRGEYDRFLLNVVRSHARSPHFLAFLYAVAPPESVASLGHNLLEEMGVEEESGESHPALLREVARGAGLGDLLDNIEARAQDDLRQVIVEPLLYGTLREIGLAVLCEVVAFEYMLSRAASRIARGLEAHRGLSGRALAWFTHHAEVDLAHAEQGLDNVVAYARYYTFTDEDALALCDMTLRGNVFRRRYFDGAALRGGINRAD